MPRSRWLTIFGGALILGGAASLAWYYSIHHASTRAQQGAQVWLDRTLAAHPAVSNALTPPVRLKRGDVVGRLAIPRLNLSVMVFEGDGPAILKRGAGHIPGTSLPHEAGNCAIAAHRDTFFRPLRLIRSHDLVEFTTPEGVFRYIITDTEIVPPSEIDVLARAPGRNLTLVTCYPFYYLGSAPKRFIVHAELIS